MKINLGCGADLRPGWINVDVRDDVGADVVCDITSTLPFADGSAREVVAQDVLEHLTTQQQRQVLAQIWRVMRPTGKLWVRLPNVDAIIARFADDPDTRNLFLYGDTSESGVWGAHKSGHTLKSFATLAREVGFKIAAFQEEATNWVVSLVKTEPVGLPRRVAFVNQTLGIGGAETFNLGLLGWLEKRGTQVEAWVTHPTLVKKLKAHRLPLVLDIIGDWKGLVKALALLPLGVMMYALVTWRSRRSDLILLTGFIEKILVTPWAKLWHIPIVWVEFGPLTSVFAKFFGLPKFLYRLVSRLPDAVIMPSVHTLEANVPWGHIPAAKVKLITCGVEVKPRRVVTEPNLVVCVSRLEKGKGQDLLLEAWPRVLQKLPSAKLRVVGVGDQYSNLKSQTSNLKVSSSVTLTGWVKDAVAEIAKARVCVFPSVWPLEGFGLVMIEAMAQNVPVVAFDVGPAKEIIDHSCGSIVAAGDASALAQAIVSQLRRPAEGGRKKYLRYYTLDKVGKQYVQVFQSAMAAHQTV